MATRTVTVPNGNGSNGHNGHSQNPLARGTLDKYCLVVACVRGNVSIQETMRRLLKDAVGHSEILPTLVLGPTAPEDLNLGSNNRIGWVTFMNGPSHPSPQVEIISPDNLLEVNLFIEKAAQEDGNQLILGDFLDNVIMSAVSPESFYSFFCQLASRLRLKKRTAVLVIKEDIHDRAVVEMVKRFADIVLELRDQDIEGTVSVEMRTLNFADNVCTNWAPFPQGLKPLSVTN
jgi:hypothetical protein